METNNAETVNSLSFYKKNRKIVFVELNEKYLFQLKQEAFPILYLSIVQTWLIFNFPAYIRLGNPWYWIVSIILSIFGIILYIVLILFPERYAPSYNVSFLDDAPNASTFKKIYKAICLLIAISTMLYFWHIDYYRMLNIDYLILYTHSIIVSLFFIRRIKRYNETGQ